MMETMFDTMDALSANSNVMKNVKFAIKESVLSAYRDIRFWMVYVHQFVVMVYYYTCMKIAMMATWSLEMVAHFAKLTQVSYVLANLWELRYVLGPLLIARSTTPMETVQSA